jgi:hypothetical protein
MASTLQSVYEESKTYTNSIIGTIASILSANDISYSIKSNDTEIVVTESDKDKKTICSLFKDSIPNDIMDTLIDVVEVGSSIYIRQVTK